MKENSKLKGKVSIVSCPDYSFERVLAGVKTSVDLLGGMDSFVRPGYRVLIKPSLVSGRPPDQAAGTHPSVAKATIQLVKEAGGIPFLGDSPGAGTFLKIAEKAGIKEVADEMNCPLVEFTDICEVENSERRIFKKIEVAKAVVDADVVISLPKIKTHSLFLLTLGIKNNFGCIPGIRKIQWHLKAGTDLSYFAKLLVEVYGIVRPELTIADGVVAMEGNGPNSGTPRHLGLIFGAVDCVALDAVITEVLSLPVQEVLTTKIAMEKGVGIGDLKEIEVLGEKIENVRIQGFRTAKTFASANLLVRILPVLFHQSMTPKPVCIHDKCTACGTCVKVCPPKAMCVEKNKIKIDYKSCIRCFCCSEVCPEDAMDIGEGSLLKFINRMQKKSE